MSDGPMIPKVLGADVELGNFFEGGSAEGSGAEASRLLLAAFATANGAVGKFDDEPTAGNGGNLQDWSRFFLPSTGGGAYIDLRHCELTLGEQPDARRFVSAWHGILLQAQQALHLANERPGARRLCALINNSDGQGHSYGGHLNLLVSDKAWTEVLERKPHLLAMLASYQAASMVVTGQGKLGTLAEGVLGRFELSQRAGFVECLVGPQTTYRRPIVNARAESHSSPDTARLHVICYDTGLAPMGTLLKVGGLQLMMAAVEAGQSPKELALDDPVESLRRWSADPRFVTRASLVDGREVTAIELLGMFMERLAGPAERAERDGIVPNGTAILEAWVTTLELLHRADWAGASRRLDWALKLGVLERALAHRPDLDWTAPALKHLDHLYASLDPNEGLYWALERAGAVERVVTPAEIEQAAAEPPAETRAWGRAMLLRRAPAWSVDDVDWDRIRFWLASAEGRAERWRVDLRSPLDATEAQWGPAFARHQEMRDLLEALGGYREYPGSAGQWSGSAERVTGSWRPDHSQGGYYRG